MLCLGCFFVIPSFLLYSFCFAYNTTNSTSTFSIPYYFVAIVAVEAVVVMIVVVAEATAAEVVVVTIVEAVVVTEVEVVDVIGIKHNIPHHHHHPSIAFSMSP